MTATNHLLWKTSLAFAKTDQQQIFIVREAIKSTKNPLYLCMIDLRAAYDHIDRDMLFSVLNIRTKAPKITSLLKALYTGTKASIKKHF